MPPSSLCRRVTAAAGMGRAVLLERTLGRRPSVHQSPLPSGMCAVLLEACCVPPLAVGGALSAERLLAVRVLWRHFHRRWFMSPVPSLPYICFGACGVPC